MLLKPTLEDVKVVAYYCARLLTAFGWLILVPFFVALISLEIEPALDIAIGASIALIFGYAVTTILRDVEELKSVHSMLIVPVAWLLVAVFAALPLYLSGHYLTFTDAIFEAMSGLTTCGLSLAVDLDHMSSGMNFYRTFLILIGGQGIIVIALTILTRSAGGVFGLFVGEGRDEKILPNVIKTARFIWVVTLSYLFIGTILGWGILQYEGIPIWQALLDSSYLVMAAFDTGGFAAHSQSVLYYHSPLIEHLLIFLMIAGSLNFNLHFAIWSGKLREIYKNIEVLMFSFTLSVTFVVAAVGLVSVGYYLNGYSLSNKTLFNLVSAHTSTGFMTIYPGELAHSWAPISMVTLIVAMALGTCVGSTGGGIKAIRIAVIAMIFQTEIKRLVLPPSAVVVTKYHHIKKVVLSEGLIRNVLIISIVYILSFLIGTLIAMIYGNSFDMALFESVSAGTPTGLSVGITNTEMPEPLKIFYIFQMWSGRLEFLSIFAFIGLIWAIAKGK